MWLAEGRSEHLNDAWLNNFYAKNSLSISRSGRHVSARECLTSIPSARLTSTPPPTPPMFTVVHSFALTKKNVGFQNIFLMCN